MQKILKGQEAAKAQLTRVHKELQAGFRRPPGLAVIQVGNLGPSNAYIRKKKLIAEEWGIQFTHAQLGSTVSKTELFAKIDALVADSKIDGLLVQLPLESVQLQTNAFVSELLAHIPPEKDADGLHSFNQGRLFTNECSPREWSGPLPATPLGIFRLLEHYGYSLVGKNVVLVGKSRLVGLPTAILLSHAGATVNICHSLTKDLAAHTRSADILVVAAGKKHLITPAHIKKIGAVVIDVGIHYLPEGGLAGDVHPDSYPQCEAYSPVPGGVGPMTVASLIENTLRLSFRSQSKL